MRNHCNSPSINKRKQQPRRSCLRGLSRHQHQTKVKLQGRGYANKLVFKVCCLTAFECSSVCSCSEALRLVQCCLNVLRVFRHPLLERYSERYKEKATEMAVRVVPIPIPVSESFPPIRFNVVSLLETGPCSILCTCVQLDGEETKNKVYQNVRSSCVTIEKRERGTFASSSFPPTRPVAA